LPNLKAKVNAKEVVEETKFMGHTYDELNAWKSDALIGFMKINIINPPAEMRWGAFNDRTINKEWVADLVKDFWVNLANCTSADAIDMVVRREWIKNPDGILAAVDGKTIQEVQEIEFTPNGLKEMAPKNLIMLGGNHRRVAMNDFFVELETQLKVTREQYQLEEINMEEVGMDQDEESDNRNRLLMSRVNELERRISNSQHWVVQLYDKG
jgi:hypothetical protein